MSYEGNLHKLHTQFKPGAEVAYSLMLGEDQIVLNDWIESTVELVFEGRINCIACGRLTKKSFGQGFCYPCFTNSPMNAPCIVRPELCEAHLGKGRDPEWEKKHHLQPHYVYLALTSGTKVGVTRITQIPTRWIDQWAWKAILLAYTDYRQQAGQIEVALKNFVSDKTPWQRMLKGEQGADDLVERKHLLAEKLGSEWADFISPDDSVTEIHYPMLYNPAKVVSQKLDKVGTLRGKLIGIRGQYLLFEGGAVLNMRSHSGYFVRMNQVD